MALAVLDEERTEVTKREAYCGLLLLLLLLDEGVTVLLGVMLVLLGLAVGGAGAGLVDEEEEEEAGWTAAAGTAAPERQFALLGRGLCTSLGRLRFLPWPLLRKPSAAKLVPSAILRVKSNCVASGLSIPSIACKGVIWPRTLLRVSTPGPSESASEGETSSNVLEPESSVSKKKTLVASHWCRLPGKVARISVSPARARPARLSSREGSRRVVDRSILDTRSSEVDEDGR